MTKAEGMAKSARARRMSLRRTAPGKSPNFSKSSRTSSTLVFIFLIFLELSFSNFLSLGRELSILPLPAVYIAIRCIFAGRWLPFS